MLKLLTGYRKQATQQAAAFGRLCVETFSKDDKHDEIVAAAFGRLCVETYFLVEQPKPSGGSRLRAAVC